MRFNYKFENKKGMLQYENDFINTKIKNINIDKKTSWRVRVKIVGNNKCKGFNIKKYGNYQAKVKAVEQLEEWRRLETDEREYAYHLKNKCDICDRPHDIKYMDGSKLCYYCSGELN